jgi:hypothetical protein
MASEAIALIGSDDDVYSRGNVGCCAGLREKVDIRGHAVEKPVSLNCIPTGQGEAE